MKSLIVSDTVENVGRRRLPKNIVGKKKALLQDIKVVQVNLLANIAEKLFITERRK